MLGKCEYKVAKKFLPTLHYRNTFLAIAVKNFAKVDIKAF